MRAFREESGFTLPEMLMVCAVTIILMGGLATIFSLGLTTTKTSSSVLASQSGVIVALDRMDYEARCASSAKLVSAGAGVTLTLPSQCPNASGTETWCVTGGSLVSASGSTCSSSGRTWVTNVTSATPFSCVVPIGDYPGIRVNLTVNTGATTSTAASGTDTITLENGVLTTSSYAGCS